MTNTNTNQISKNLLKSDRKMTRYYLLFFFSIITFSAISQENISFKISSTIPQSIGAGNEFLVELIIEKPEIHCFAQYKQYFPKGFLVQEVNCIGGELSYENNELQITWLRLPKQSKLNIIFKVQTSSSFSGSFISGGTFTYIIGNKTGTIKLPNSVIAIKKPGDPVVYNEQNESNTEKKTDTKDLRHSTTEQRDTTTQKNSISNNTSAVNVDLKNSVSCVRLQPTQNLQTGEITISLKIKKGTISSAARVTEILPAGYEAKESESLGAVFTFIDNNATFIWNKIPMMEEFIIKYTIVPLDKSNKIIPEISGQLLYVQGGKVIPAIIQRNY
jgi:hypothetical protein